MKRLLLILLPLLMCGAASFNGSSQGSSTTVSVPFGTNVISLSYFIKHSSTNVGKVVIESGLNAAITNNTFYASSSEGGSIVNFESFSMRGTANNIWRVTTPMALNAWSHRCVVLNKATTYGNLTVYIDGVSAGLARPYASLTNSSGTASFSDQVLYVGARNISSARFSGLIQDLAIFAGEVSAAEAYMLAAQRMSPLKVRSAKLINYWPFSAGENSSNSPDLVGGIPVNSGTKSIVLEQAPTYRK